MMSDNNLFVELVFHSADNKNFNQDTWLAISVASTHEENSEEGMFDVTEIIEGVTNWKWQVIESNQNWHNG